MIFLILFPLELLISSYRIQFWHIWLPVGIFFVYLSLAINTVENLSETSKNCYLLNVYPGMISLDYENLIEFGLLLLSFIVSLIVGVYLLLWGFTFIFGGWENNF